MAGKIAVKTTLMPRADTAAGNEAAESGQYPRVPVPTESEITAAIAKGREVVGCSAVRYGLLIVLKIAYDNGDTAIACLDPVERSHILRALKALAPELERAPAAQVTIGPLGAQVQVGRMSG